jgi:hypothetical protein
MHFAKKEKTKVKKKPATKNTWNSYVIIQPQYKTEYNFVKIEFSINYQY